MEKNKIKYINIVYFGCLKSNSSLYECVCVCVCGCMCCGGCSTLPLFVYLLANGGTCLIAVSYSYYYKTNKSLVQPSVAVTVTAATAAETGW